jgi:diacylglycerol kinase family enzyme
MDIVPVPDREDSWRNIEMHETSRRYQLHSFESGAHMTVLVLLNTGAGSIKGADSGDLEKRLRIGFQARGIETEVRLAEGREIAEMARQFAVSQSPGGRSRMLVVGGGDGTLGSAASAIAGTNVVMGVLPLGTLNHFARDIGLPKRS